MVSLQAVETELLNAKQLYLNTSNVTPVHWKQNWQEVPNSSHFSENRLEETLSFLQNNSIIPQDLNFPYGLEMIFGKCHEIFIAWNSKPPMKNQPPASNYSLLYFWVCHIWHTSHSYCPLKRNIQIIYIIELWLDFWWSPCLNLFCSPFLGSLFTSHVSPSVSWTSACTAI